MQVRQRMDPQPVLDWYRPALVYAAIFVAAAGAGGARLLSDRLTLATLAVTALAGAATATFGYVRLLALREQADRWIRGDHRGAVARDVIVEREQELLSARHRHSLALGLRRIIDDAGKPFSVSARVPVAAVAVSREQPALADLGDLLDDRATPVSPRCVALVESLLTDPGSPLFRSSSADGPQRLAERLGQIRFELERGA
jgi:hypothetical protein